MAILAATLLELGPSSCGPFTFVAEPARGKVVAADSAGQRPLVECLELTDEKTAFTNYADCASAVAFAKLPRPHLLHSWKSQGVTVLKRITCDGSPNRLRREAGFLAVTEEADGIWLANPKTPTNAQAKPPQNAQHRQNAQAQAPQNAQAQAPQNAQAQARQNAQAQAPKNAQAEAPQNTQAQAPQNAQAQALTEARRDRRILSELAALAAQAKTNANPAVAIEARRVQFFLASGIFEWENLDTLRLECEAWRRRLEQLLGLGGAGTGLGGAGTGLGGAGTGLGGAETGLGDMTRRDAASTEQAPSTLYPLPTTNYQLSTTYDFRLFSLVYTSTNAPSAGAKTPGGALDFSLWIADGRGGFLPYRFHCDLEPMIAPGPRAPARGRGGWLYGTDERFRPYSISYGARNSRVTVFPRLGDYGPDYPDPRPSFEFKVSTNGWKATLSISWLSLYGKWPMQRDGVADVWYASVHRSESCRRDVPVPSSTLAITFPRGSSKNFRRFCEAISTGELTEIYKEELRRTETAYATSFEERMYPFATTPSPTFQRGDLASDKMFLERIVQPLLDRNENTWKAVWTDKEHKPTFDRLPDAAKMQAWKNLGKLLYLSHEVSRLRGQYLADRFAGREPPPYVRRDLSRETPPEEPDPDFDETDIQLDDKEY